MENNLYDLFNAENYHDLISIDNQDANILKNILKSMLIIRKTENKLALEKKKGLITGPVHLGAGQEAIAVGVSQNLKKQIRFLEIIALILICWP